MKYILALVALLFTIQVQAFEYITIDNFATAQAPLVKVIATQGSSTAWYTIYQGDSDFAGPPDADFHTTTDCLGGQRDVVLGHEGVTPVGSVAVISLVNQRASVAFPLNYVGGAYFQWDGNDSAGSVSTSLGDSAFPGAILSTSPGIGDGETGPLVNGGRVDFTAGGSGIGIGISISADLQVSYFLDALDSAGNQNTLAFIHQPVSEDQFTRYFFTYTDNRWTLGGSFNWGDVAAFQVRVFTFDLPVDANPQAIDTDFFAVGVIGYIIQGNLFQDCGCDGTPDSFTSNAQFDLRLGSATTGTPFASTFTDINGNFEFTGLIDGTYTICMSDLNNERCSPTNGCRTVTLANQIDPPTILYSTTQVSSLVAPPDAFIECGECQTVQCLGAATANVCGGLSTTVTTFTDSNIVGTCPQTFTRTFTDDGQFARQTITITDSLSPVVVTPAQSISRSCDDNQQISYNAWISARANSEFDDCNSMSFSNNAGNQPGNCGSTTVTFTATDICGNQRSTTGSYTTFDNTAPAFVTSPQDDSANCDLAGGSDFNAFNTWLASNAGAVINDNCGGVTITNNFVQGSLVRGCNSPLAVTFTATDNCGNTDSQIATFTIIDNSGPVISPGASSPVVTCNAQSSTAFNTWLADFGNANAADACQDNNGLNFANDFSGVAPFGCDDSRTVTFTVSDPCGRTSSTTGTFTVRDNGSPTLTQQASPLSVNCELGASDDLDVWLQDAGGARATDDCLGNVSFTNDFNSLSGDCTQVPVTFTGCDGCGNCVSTTSTYSIVDNTPPTITVPPQSQSVQCASDTQAAFDAWVASGGNGVFSDNCASGNELSFSNDAPNNAPVGGSCENSVVVSFRARDPCGNLSPAATAQFTVLDNTPPSITNFPVDQTVDCDPTSNSQAYSQWRSTRGGATATDLCSSVSFSNDGPNAFALANGDCFDSITVVFTASDVCGNTSPVTASFTIIDNSPPTLITPASDSQSECNASAVNTWLADNGGARATDTCTAIVWTNNFFAFNGGCTETAFVTFTATDACGNAVDTSATYSVTDSQPPVIQPRASPLSVPCDSNTGSALSNWLNTQGGAVATDSCQDDNDLTWSNNFASAVVGCDFVDVVFTVTDACGNTANTSARFTSVDNDAPTFSPAAQDLTVECNGSGNVDDFNTWVASRAGANAIDACALSITFSNNAPNAGPVTCNSVNVAFTAEDECGNSAVTTARFTVADTIAPSIITSANDRTVECDGLGNSQDRNEWVQDNGGARASDVCSSTVSWNSNVDSNTGDSCATVFIYSFTALDSCGNSAVTTASYTIRDFTAPEISVEPTDVSFECDGNGNIGQITAWVNDNAGARASDVCQGGVSFVNDFVSDGLFTCSSIAVGFTATDNCGNVVSRTATVTVEDNVDPVWTFFPEDITVPCDADTSTDVLGFAVASDACAGDIFVNFSEIQDQEPPNGNCPGDIILTRTFSAFDDCGNSITRDQLVTVNIARSSGPCDPVGCECDDCCPPAAPSDCLPVDCQPTACRSTPCQAATCTCEDGNQKSITRVQRQVEEIDELPQCKPVYIYVNDDDDEQVLDVAAVSSPRMLVTNEPLHENILNRNSAGVLSVSFLLVVLATLLFV